MNMKSLGVTCIFLIVVIPVASYKFAMCPKTTPWTYVNTTIHGRKDLTCYKCNSPKSCKKPPTAICNPAEVNWTAEQMRNVFGDVKENIFPSEYYECFAFETARLDGKSFTVRGCMYSPREPQQVYFQYIFDFLKFFKVRVRTMSFTLKDFTYGGGGNLRTSTLSKIYEEHDRVYWNTSHYTKDVCFQCEDSLCNKVIYPGSRKLFQRRFLNGRKWSCNKLLNVQEQKFRDICTRYKIQGFCEKKHWKYPKPLYHPYLTDFIYRIRGTTFTMIDAKRTYTYGPKLTEIKINL